MQWGTRHRNPAFLPAWPPVENTTVLEASTQMTFDTCAFMHKTAQTVYIIYINKYMGSSVGGKKRKKKKTKKKV